MLNFSSKNRNNNLSLLCKDPLKDKISSSKGSIYNDSEALSTYISDNILEALRKQLDSEKLKSNTNNVDSDKKLNSTN